MNKQLAELDKNQQSIAIWRFAEAWAEFQLKWVQLGLEIAMTDAITVDMTFAIAFAIAFAIVFADAAVAASAVAAAAAGLPLRLCGYD